MEFREEKRGYDRAQVDRYIEMLQTEYETMHGEFQKLTQRCDKLAAEVEKANGVIDKLQSENAAGSGYSRQPYSAAANYPPANSAAACSPYGAQAPYGGSYLSGAYPGNSWSGSSQMLLDTKREAELQKAAIRKEVDDMVMAKLKITSELREIQSAISKLLDTPRRDIRSDTR